MEEGGLPKIHLDNFVGTLTLVVRDFILQHSNP